MKFVKFSLTLKLLLFCICSILDLWSTLQPDVGLYEKPKYAAEVFLKNAPVVIDCYLISITCEWHKQGLWNSASRFVFGSRKHSEESVLDCLTVVLSRYCYSLGREENMNQYCCSQPYFQTHWSKLSSSWEIIVGRRN
jgi:hypothetical protein